MIGLVVTEEAALRADAADVVGTVLNDLFHELARTEHVFLVQQVCERRGVEFKPSKVPLQDVA